MSTRRVLHVIANLDVGGAQEVVTTLVPHLSGYGWQPLVATFRDGPLRARIEGAGVPVAILPGRTRSLTGAGSLGEIRTLRGALAGLIAEHRIDIVQTHLARAADFLVLSLHLGRRDPPLIGIIWTVHNARLDLRADQVPRRSTLPVKRVAYRWSYRIGSRLGAEFVAVSDEVAVSIERDYRPRRGSVHVITNGVDVARFGRSVEHATIRADLGIPPDAPTVAVVAKLFTQKGHRDLIAAMVPVRSQVPDVRVLIVGEGPLRSELEHLTNALGLGDRVRFLGLRTDIPAILASADLFVLPSIWEGLPVALLEAMASGLPVVATSVSGTVQVVQDGVSGILVPPGHPERLATAIVNVLQNPARARALGEAGRARVGTTFSVERQAREHGALYDELADRARAHR